MINQIVQNWLKASDEKRKTADMQKTLDILKKISSHLYSRQPEVVYELLICRCKQCPRI